MRGIITFLPFYVIALLCYEIWSTLQLRYIIITGRSVCVYGGLSSSLCLSGSLRSSFSCCGYYSVSHCLWTVSILLSDLGVPCTQSQHFVHLRSSQYTTTFSFVSRRSIGVAFLNNKQCHTPIIINNSSQFYSNINLVVQKLGIKSRFASSNRSTSCLSAILLDLTVQHYPP